MPNSEDDWFTCPVCGEVVKANALACPHCGSDDETGWSQDAEYDDADLPDGAFGEVTPRPPRSRSPLFQAVAVLLVLLILLLVLAGVW